MVSKEVFVTKGDGSKELLDINKIHKASNRAAIHLSVDFK